MLWDEGACLVQRSVWVQASRLMLCIRCLEWDWSDKVLNVNLPVLCHDVLHTTTLVHIFRVLNWTTLHFSEQFGTNLSDSHADNTESKMVGTFFPIEYNLERS